jgi:hypothetical protein
MQQPLTQSPPAELTDLTTEQDAYAEFWACVEDAEPTAPAGPAATAEPLTDAYELFLDSADPN